MDVLVFYLYYLLQVVINRYKHVYITSVHYHMHKACDTMSHHEVIRSCEQSHSHVDLVHSTLPLAKISPNISSTT